MKLNKRTYYILMFLFALVGFLFSSAYFLWWGMLHSGPDCAIQVLLVFLLPFLFFALVSYSLYMLCKLVLEGEGGIMEFGRADYVEKGFMLIGILLLVWFSLVGYCEPTPWEPREGCRFPTGIYCSDYMVEMNKIQFLIENGLGRDIIVKNVVVTETSVSPLHLCEMTSGEIAIPNGESATIIADKCIIASVTVGTKYRYDIDFTYLLVDSGEEYTLQGELFAKVIED